MIKKTTLLVLLGAALLGAGVYFLDVKRGEKQKEKASADERKTAFSIGSGAEIKSMTIAQPAVAGEAAVRLEKRDGNWWMVAPLQTDANDQRRRNGTRIAGPPKGLWSRPGCAFHRFPIAERHETLSPTGK
jgi:hypothetical protein